MPSSFSSQGCPVGGSNVLARRFSRQNKINGFADGPSPRWQSSFPISLVRDSPVRHTVCFDARSCLGAGTTDAKDGRTTTQRVVRHVQKR
ncbi:hypothetical protein RRG08_052815 [Elysia crispata]|uniref:Uncharacterized protein n=1 Tax=Elysia crispata TaxID=231223 RepID=A0AAE1EB19_9GAST|nr:hypothetical protein RRG08_052815 [Elysia crispata]